MMKKITLVILLITALCVGTVLAIPVMPDEWYGSVYLNGNPAPAGTVIVVQVDGQTAGQVTTTKDGLYGSQSGQDNLYATATEEQLNKGPATVTFLVNGIQAFQAVRYEPGNLTKLDIYADSKTMPTAPPTLPPSSVSMAGSGASQPTAGGFPVLTGTTTPAPTNAASTGASTTSGTGQSVTGPGSPGGQKPQTGAASGVSPASSPGSTGSAATLPSMTIIGIVIVIIVIALAVFFLMRKKGMKKEEKEAKK